MFVTIHFGKYNFSLFWKLLFGLFRGFVPNRTQHVAKSTPIRIKVDEDEFIVSCKNKNWQFRH